MCIEVTGSFPGGRGGGNDGDGAAGVTGVAESTQNNRSRMPASLMISKLSEKRKAILLVSGEDSRLISVLCGVRTRTNGI